MRFRAAVRVLCRLPGWHRERDRLRLYEVFRAEILPAHRAGTGTRRDLPFGNRRLRAAMDAALRRRPHRNLLVFEDRLLNDAVLVGVCDEWSVDELRARLPESECRKLRERFYVPQPAQYIAHRLRLAGASNVILRGLFIR